MSFLIPKGSGSNQMWTGGLHVKLTGVDELMRKLGPGLVGPALTRMFRSAGRAIEPEMRSAFPSDTGALRRDVRTLIDPAMPPMWAKIGPSKKGFYGHILDVGAKPHWPGLGPALTGWAARHGFSSAWPIAMAISKRGIKPRNFMEQVLRNAERIVADLMRKMGDDIQQTWKA